MVLCNSSSKVQGALLIILSISISNHYTSLNCSNLCCVNVITHTYTPNVTVFDFGASKYFYFHKLLDPKTKPHALLS